MGTLDTTGYSIKTQNEYFEDEIALYQGIDANWNLDPSSPDGLKAAHDAEVLAALDQLVKQAYDARDPNKATGKDLDVLRALTGATRSPGTPSTVTLYVTGVAGTKIPAGSRVKTAGGVMFAFDAAVTIGSDGVGSGAASCTENGATEVAVGALSTIVDIVGGWQTVENRTVAVLGTDEDSDAEFRIKSARAVASASVGIKESIYPAIYAVDGVRKVAVYENRTNSAAVQEYYNPYGIPAHSIAIVVDGGTDEDVARAIYSKVSVGVTLHAAGTAVTRLVYSENYRNSYDVITFGRPVDVPIQIVITVKDPNGNCPLASDLQDEIAEAFVEYYNGELLPDGIGFKTSGFDIGEDVPYTRLFTPVNKVLGSYDGTYVSSMTVNGGTSNVSIDFDKIARFTKANVTVSIEE